MLIPLLRTLVGTDSQLKISNQQVAKVLAQTYARLGARVRMTAYQSDGVRRWNVRAEYGQNLPGRPLVFSGHTDTANVHGSWATPPVKVVGRGKRLYGLGISDMKSSIAAFTTAFAETHKRIQRPVTILLDGDEEGHAVGGALLAQKRPARSATIIVGEATDNRVRLGQKACFDACITTTGIGKHASRVRYATNGQENAILKLAKVLQALRVYEKRIDARRHPAFGRATLSYGTMSGGVGVNTVAPLATLAVNRRLVPQEKLAEEKRALRALVRRVDASAQVTFPFSGDGFFTARSEAWVQYCLQVIRKETGAPAEIMYAPGWTEASLFTRWGRVFVLGPGDSSTIHQVDESIALTALDRGVALYRTFLLLPNL
ncbi:MAG: M20/M25/M40 family metallo-hydrolase [bacterium]|nr:M20/M25/M40 family metallo-hydrolase [bacterium]